MVRCSSSMLLYALKCSYDQKALGPSGRGVCVGWGGGGGGGDVLQCCLTSRHTIQTIKGQEPRSSTFPLSHSSRAPSWTLPSSSILCHKHLQSQNVLLVKPSTLSMRVLQNTTRYTNTHTNTHPRANPCCKLVSYWL